MNLTKMTKESLYSKKLLPAKISTNKQQYSNYTGLQYQCTNFALTFSEHYVSDNTLQSKCYFTVPNKRGFQLEGDGKILENLMSGGPNKRGGGVIWEIYI